MTGNLLDIVKQSDNGLTLEQLAQRCQEEGIDMQPQAANLLERGKVRIDTSETPVLLKATPKAWEQ